MKYLPILGLFFLFAATKCDKADTFPLGEAFTMMPGQLLVNKDAQMVIQWKSVSEDSRCPKYTNCVWQGQAVIELMVDEAPLTLTLQEGKPAQAKGTVAGRTITAQALDPYPESDKVIDPADYVLELVVE